VVAAGSAALLWGAFYPGLSVLVWPALGGLFWSLSGRGGSSGAKLGMVAGLTYFALTFSSILQLWNFVGALALPLWILLAVYAALYMAVFGAAVGRWRSPLVWAGAWMLLEVARVAGPLGTAFGTLPGALAVPPWVGAAAVGGPWLLSFAASWTAGCAVAGWRGRRAWLLLALLGPGILFSASGLAPHTEQVDTLRVAIVQTGVTQEDRLDAGQVPQLMDHYRSLLGEIEQPVDLVVFPETVLPVPLPDRPELMEAFQQAAQRLDADLLVGTGDRRDDGVYNSTLLVSPEGEVVGSYDKMHLVPFGEYLPARGLWEAVGLGPLLRDLLPHDLAPGGSDEPIGAYGVRICFESQFPKLARRSVAHEAELLVVPTNDAWFGRDRLLWDHFAFGALRAAEQGRAFIHATTTGWSGAFDPRGRLAGDLPLLEPDVLYVQLPLHRGRTPYAVVGDWPVLALAAVLVAGGIAWERRYTRSQF